MSREIYLDNSATTKPYDEVIELISDISRNTYGNPSSLHTKGIEAERLIKKSREILAHSLQGETKEIYFTSGGTESNNLAIKGYLEANPRKGKHIITTRIEHPSVLEVYKHLGENGYKVDYIGVDSDGIIHLDELESKICSETSLISIILVNNETGTIQPIEEIAEIKNRTNPDTVIHIDAVQAYGKIPFDRMKTGIDMVSVSSHKIHGPKGVGALYAGKKLRIKPVLLGGGQESTLRSGTENVPGICGFGLAAEKTFASLETHNQKVAILKNIFIKQVKENLRNFHIISPERSSPYILNISFEHVKSEVLLHHLEERNIYVSTGSACSSRKNIHSPVLKAMGLESMVIDGAIRFSFSNFNQEEDILLTIEALKDILPKIQSKLGGRT